MQMQILDCDYTLVNNRPIIRLFGKTADGRTICAFYDKFLPYFYLHTEQIGDAIAELKKSFDISVEIVEKCSSEGYQDPVPVIKITGKDPAKIPEIREFAKKFGKCYEADILFKYRFMADYNLKGMGWVDVKGKQTRTSTVKAAAIEAEQLEPIEIVENAPLRYLAFDIECITDKDRLPNAELDQIIIISLAFCPEYKNKETIILLAKPLHAGPDVIGCENEKEMLKSFLEILNSYDPDIIVGYNINNFDLPYLLKRLEVLKLPRDLGRTEKYAFCRKLQYTQVPTISGRVVVDPYEIIKRDPWVRFKRYDLKTIAKEVLGLEKIELEGIAEMRAMWNGGDIRKFIDYARRDSELALKLVTQQRLLDKFFELAKISGLLLQDSLGGQTQRHECKLLHEFRKKGFLMPCRPDKAELRKRKEEREIKELKGALVLEPIVGLHTKGCTLVLDFTSLYPSIIRTYNICPTTILFDDKKLDYITSPYGTKFVTPKVREGILPKIINELIETRRHVREKIRTERDYEIKRILNAKQLGLKTMANSLYGYTAYLRSRLYIMDIANSITSFGREAITKTKKLIESNFPVKVLYSDTDSIFIKTDIEDLDLAERLGNEIANFVTGKLTGLELKFEKLFKTFLILTKKRYAGWVFEKEDGKWDDKIEMKGIETVRRDWCSLTTKTMQEVLEILLKEQDVKKASRYVRGILYDLASSKIPLEQLTIIKGISKSLESYDGVQPHVELAKKLRKREPTKGSFVGERIGYVIIKGNALLSKRAEDPAYVKQKGLEIDPTYYIENQLLPPIERIFEVCGINKSELIEGFKQKNLAVFTKAIPPEQTILKGFDSIVCKSCNWSFRRPPLVGICPKCSSDLYFSKAGSIGKFVISQE